MDERWIEIMYRMSLILKFIHNKLTMTPKTESMHQTRTFMGISQKDNDIFRKCKM